MKKGGVHEELDEWIEVPLGGNHPKAQVFEDKSFKNEEMEEEEKGPPLQFVYPLLPPLFTFLFIVVFSLQMFYFIF